MAVNVGKGLRRVALVVIAVAIVVNALAYLLGWYQQFWWFDEALHAYTTFAVTLPVGIVFIEQIARRRASRWMVVCAVAALGMALGVVWEIVELAAVQAAGVELGHPQGESRYDTVVDLVMDTVGAVVAAILLCAKAQHSDMHVLP